mgnify:CR=1 FL=1
MALLVCQDLKKLGDDLPSRKKEKSMKQFKAVVAYHPTKGVCRYQVMKIQGARPAINGLYRVGMWLDEKAVENVGRFADLTVIIGK